MASIKINGRWMNITHYETGEDGLLLSCRVSRPGDKDYHLVVQRGGFGPSEALQALAAITTGAAAGGALADRWSENEPPPQRTYNVIISSIFGGFVGMAGYAMTMKEPGYYDFTTSTKKIIGLINVKSSPNFRLT